MLRWWQSLTRGEQRALAGALTLGLLVRVLAVVDRHGEPLRGDEDVYHGSAVLQTMGKWFWSDVPQGVPHESLNKVPAYQVWVGLWYEVLGVSPGRVLLAQAVILGPLVIVATFVLARRLFGSRAAMAAAVVVAVYPFAWTFEEKLLSESIAVPLTTVAFIVALTSQPSRRSIVTMGLLMGALLYVRPTSFVVLPLLGICWWGQVGFRRAFLPVAGILAVAILVVAPWMYRNHQVDPDHFVPLSTQDAAAFGTFNDDAANDPEYPYKWRGVNKRDLDLFNNPELSDGELREIAQKRTREFIEDHPDALYKAFWHNGIVRLWDFDPIQQTLKEAELGGHGRGVWAVGLAMYWLLLPLALLGLRHLWVTDRRRIVIGLLASAATASVIYTADAGTRYRAVFEPVIVTLAAGGALSLGRLRENA